MNRLLFGLALLLVAVVYLWLAYQSLGPGLQRGDWVAYLGTLLFLAAGVVAALAAVNLMRPKRR